MSGPMEDNSSDAKIYERLKIEQFDADDHAIIDRLLATTREVDRCFSEFEFSAAVQALYAFFWNDFCDWYVEVSKTKLQSPELKANCLAIQDFVLRQTLLLLHPFIPFITEELWQELGYSTDGKFIEDTRLENASQVASAGLLRGLSINYDAAAEIQRIKQTVSLLRALKAENGEAANKQVEFVVEGADRQWATVEAHLAKLKRMVGAGSITRASTIPGGPVCVTAHGSWTLMRQLKGDPVVERARLTKEIEALAKHIASTEARLANVTFVSKAPPAVLEGARKQLAELQSNKLETERLLAGLG